MCLLNTSKNRQPSSSCPVAKEGLWVALSCSSVTMDGADKDATVGVESSSEQLYRDQDANQPASFQTGKQQKQETTTGPTLKRKVK
jgi:hypothetical protein